MPKYHGLLEDVSGIVLTISPYVAPIFFLKDSIPNTHDACSMQRPNYREAFPLASVDPIDYPRSSWDSKNKTLKETPGHLLTPDILARSHIATVKRDAISKIMRSISKARYQTDKGVAFQETVYLTKKNQAQRFKDSGYNENLLLEFPYVLQDSEYEGMTMRQAADNILFRAKLDDDLLAKTEFLRRKYFNRVKTANTDEELSTIIEDFYRDYRVNARV